MDNKQKMSYVMDYLKKKYPDAKCTLEHGSVPYKMLIMVRLSAQCTDARVNRVAPELFARFQSIEDFADANIYSLEDAIYSCGLYKTKAKHIKGMCRMLKERFNCVVPDNMEELLQLPGVGRKTANLILCDLFGKPAIVADTHCIRVNRRLGLCTSTVPDVAEQQIWECVPEDRYDDTGDFCHRLVYFGREICISRSPKCHKCPFEEICNGRKAFR